MGQRRQMISKRAIKERRITGRKLIITILIQGNERAF